MLQIWFLRQKNKYVCASIWGVLRRGLETRFLIENKGMSVNKHALMLKKPHNRVSCAYVGVRDCKNKWWLVAWVYQSPVGQDHLFVFAVLGVINPSCSFPSCENVKGETPPPLTKPKCRESPSSRQTPTTPRGSAGPGGAPPARSHRLCGAEEMGRAPADGIPQPGGCAPSRAALSPGLCFLQDSQPFAKQVGAPWEEEGLYATPEQGLATFPYPARAVLEAVLLYGWVRTWNHSS